MNDAITDPNSDAPEVVEHTEDPTERGSLEIAPRVVEKIAARAVAEIDLATGTPRSVLGQTLGQPQTDTPARTSARLDGRVVSIDVSMAVRWPADVRAVTREVRRRVIDRVGQLTGLSVAEVDIDVPALLTAVESQRRVR